MDADAGLLAACAKPPATVDPARKSSGRSFIGS
jgi:hypothetical protein